MNKKNKNQEKIQAALERIEKGLDTINTDEDWLHFLAFQSLFYNYSFRNAMLIYLQNPEASYVKGFKAWNELGRYVKKGAKGLAIQVFALRSPSVQDIRDFRHPHIPDEDVVRIVQGNIRGDSTQEYLRRIRHRAGILHVVDDGPADICGQREHQRLSCLVLCDPQFMLFPVDIPRPEAADVADPQTGTLW